jgi:two-component system, NarL family, nitrate/nitrite response regulator NarL
MTGGDEPPLGSVLIADAQPTWRLGIRVALEQAGFLVVAERPTAAEAVAGALTTRPDACVLDISLAGGGLHAARAVTMRLPDTAVIMLTPDPNEDELFAALGAGASAYLPKATGAVHLVATLRAVLAGEVVVPRAMVTSLVQELRMYERRRELARLAERDVHLTPREWQVMHLLDDDLSTSEVAAQLGISVITVRRHISHVLHKLGAHDRRTALRLFRNAADIG